MQQLEFFSVPSPCVGVCNNDEKGYCQGCMRKRDERFTWLQMTPAEQRHVIKLCQQRYRRKMMKERVEKEGELNQNEIAPTNPQEELF